MKNLGLNLLLTLIISLEFSSLKSKDFAIINSNKFNNLLVKTALDIESKKKGLMQVDKLMNYNGMLFLYELPRKVNIWMYKTSIPLDIIFINKQKRIVSIKKGIPNSKILISSDVDVLAVLEIPDGCAKKLKIKKGDRIKWFFKNNSEIKNIRYYHCL